jgi:hypothetical protein
VFESHIESNGFESRMGTIYPLHFYFPRILQANERVTLYGAWGGGEVREGRTFPTRSFPIATLNHYEPQHQQICCSYQKTLLDSGDLWFASRVGYRLS